MPKSHTSRLQQNQQHNGMENLNLHKQKIYALLFAAVALITLLLPWQTYSGGFGGFGMVKGTVNGFKGWGWLSFLGIIAIVVASLLEDKSKPFEGNMRLVALGGFGLIVLGAVIFLIRVLSVGNQIFKSSPGFGLIICLIVGAAGLAATAGVIQLPDLKKSGTSAPPPPPPAPPTPPTPPAS